jgi:phosphate-induced protein 1
MIMKVSPVRKTLILMAGVLGVATALCEAGPLSNTHSTPIPDATATASSTAALSYGPLVSSTNGVTYSSSAITSTHVNVYVVWYGTWSVESSTALVANFLRTLSASPAFRISSMHAITAGESTPRKLNIAATTTDAYSHGTNLPDEQIPAIVTAAISSGRLPADTDGVYFVLTSPDVVPATAASIGTPTLQLSIDCNGVWDVDWAFVPGATFYQIWVAHPGSSPFVLETTTTGDTTSFGVGGRGGVAAKLEVQACNATSCGALSSPVILSPYSGCE